MREGKGERRAKGKLSGHVKKENEKFNLRKGGKTKKMSSRKFWYKRKKEFFGF